MTSPPTANLDEVFADFEPVGLEELVATADLQTRKDRKYLVPLSSLPDVLAELGDARILTIDERHRFAYRSTYFDTPRLRSYLDAARKRPSRFKVRTRNYLDSDLCMLEVKTRDRRGRTVKHRISCSIGNEHNLDADAQAFITSIEETAGIANRLFPTLTTTYDRTTVLLPGNHPARLTFDTDLVWRTGSEHRRTLGPLALIETKTTGRPCLFDHILWQHGHRPSKISKYCTGLAAAYPQLPANKWNRVLRQHLDWTPHRHPADAPDLIAVASPRQSTGQTVSLPQEQDDP